METISTLSIKGIRRVETSLYRKDSQLFFEEKHLGVIFLSPMRVIQVDGMDVGGRWRRRS